VLIFRALGTRTRAIRIYVYLWWRETDFLFSFSEISNRPSGEACCFSATCDWTAKDELLHIEPNGKWWKTPLCFDMTSNDIVNYMWTHPVVIRSWGNTKIWVCWWEYQKVASCHRTGFLIAKECVGSNCLLYHCQIPN